MSEVGSARKTGVTGFAFGQVSRILSATARARVYSARAYAPCVRVARARVCIRRSPEGKEKESKRESAKRNERERMRMREGETGEGVTVSSCRVLDVGIGQVRVTRGSWTMAHAGPMSIKKRCP